MSNGYLTKIFPLIDRAAEAARGRAKKVILDSHQLWMVYVQERERLLDGAIAAKNGEPVDREDFEAYLISLGGESHETVWAWEPSSDSETDSI